MAKAKKTGKSHKNKNLPLILCAAIVAVGAIIAAATASGAFGGGRAQVIGAGESLSIPTAQVTEAASFYPVSVDGVNMEVIAIRDSEGEIRTAFNTCQSCYTSGKGYYKADGPELVCQNCGFRFTAEEVQIETGGGCNPYPIFGQNKTERDNEILISYDFLKSSCDIFANWKKT